MPVDVYDGDQEEVREKVRAFEGEGEMVEEEEEGKDHEEVLLPVCVQDVFGSIPLVLPLFVPLILVVLDLMLPCVLRRQHRRGELVLQYDRNFLAW